jgi:ribonuclease VapC
VILVDASVLVALVVSEPDAGYYEARLDAALGTPILAMPIGIFEATQAVARLKVMELLEARADVEVTLKVYAMEVVPLLPIDADDAIAAAARYGKGRHPAALNLGDCFAYAVAKRLGAALLYKGGDFALTDLA